MKETMIIISGWAHGPEAVQPMADALTGRYEISIRTGAEILHDRFIPEADCIITGSMGGLLAMELLPTSCRKLVLISSTARFCATPDYPFGTAERILKRMILQLQREPEAVLDEFFRNVHYPHRESRQAMEARQAGSQSLGELVAGLEYLLQADVRCRVPGIRIPVLLLHGEQDRIIPPGASRWLHAHLPDSTLEIIEDDGHALPAHHFAGVINRIEAFLD